MAESLGEALPKAIATVSEWIGQQEQQAKEMDSLMAGAGAGQRMMANVVRAKRDIAIAAMNSGDVVAMISAYEQLKPAVELATDNADPRR